MRTLLLLLFSTVFLSAEKVASVATLVPEVSAVEPGEPFTVALKLEHPIGWHSYYKNSGGVELPPQITWKLPEGATAGPIHWPVPQVKEGYGGKSFIYTESPVFLVVITPSESAPVGEKFEIAASAKWQICKLSCINENADFKLSLPIENNAKTDTSRQKFFTQARSQIPLKFTGSFDVEIPEDENRSDFLSIRLSNLTSPPTEFIPDQPYLNPLSMEGEVATDGDDTIIYLARKKTDFLDQPIRQDNKLSGILTAGENILITEKTAAAPAARPISFSSLLPILGGMFIGGLILNLMPCVFPVIGLKIMGFVQQAGEDRRSIALHGVSFAMGVIASFGVLSGILFVVRAAALKTGGDQIGWGYQLQNPWVVLVLMLLMFILALNMFGLFELGTSATSVGGKLQNKSGHAGSFFSGVLATVVATPCSAPFLGAAIGAAMALPALQFFSAFAAMALGLALPYLFLSLFPRFVEKLPRPGPWMESFKQAMSFLLFATVAYLLWVYSGLIGQEYLLMPLLGLSMIAAAGWIYGRWFLPHKSGKARATGIILAATFAISGVVLAFPPKPNDLWEPWSQARVDELMESGTPVYIDFTAQWCVTCQVNKKVAYTDDVLSLAKEKGIVFLKADKTRPDPTIEAKLQELGRTAIPVNVLINPGEKPIITKEVLTPGILMDLFEKAQ
ncbi:protein-disulfide reductase DsbD family protein [Luteolibacter sp. AS25]|uniref:protein-disulfide reductase DsbD family protein n=1 Tax=Luteolibacter sp. AS25 TaxID=3135776 RepID=UPI00398B4C19